jgi:hypothetical protein
LWPLISILRWAQSSKRKFFEGSLIAIHHSSFLSGLSIFLLKLDQDSSFLMIIGKSNHISFALPSKGAFQK